MNTGQVLRIFLFALCIAFGCTPLRDPSPSYTYTIPGPLEDEFLVSSLEAEGVDENLIREMSDLIIREKYKRVDGVLIARNNKLVYENYFQGYANDILHNIFSAGKSITSILVGIATDKGFIEGVNTPVTRLLPEYHSFLNPDPRKYAITVEDLLNMTSGLDCNDWNQQTEGQMQQADDWVKFTLDLPMTNDPGSRGSYCTGCAVTLGRVIENTSGLSLQEFANEYLFQPLNIKEYRWYIMPDGRASGGGLLFLRPRDMVRIGLLMLNDGMANGVQVVSKEWVERCRQNTINLAGPFDGYGNLWWKQSFSDGSQAYFADGNGGQQIFIIPSKELVVVFTGGNMNTGLGLQNFEILDKYILPATK